MSREQRLAGVFVELADTLTPLSPTRRGNYLSRDAVEHRLAHYAKQATTVCPSLHGKTITAHVLRHTTAMRLLHAGVDTSVIALWLGHVSIDTTQIYLHADLDLKEQALARTRPPNGRTGRYQPPDNLLDAVIKLLWLAIRDIEDKRARARAKERGKKANQRTAPGRLVEGAVVQGWKQALNALAIAYPGRLPEHLN